MSSVLGNLKKGLVFVVSAPAGTGKTTLVDMVAKEFPCVVPSISYTTRQPRGAEVNGVHYHFVSQPEFEQKITNNKFLEYVQLYGHYYGTSKKWVEDATAAGKHVILTIDTQGAKALREILPAVYIFVLPPSIEVLEERLKGRQTESKEDIRTRLAWVHKELEASRQYDYHIVNDDLTTAYDVLRSILIAEEHRSVNSQETNGA